MSLWLSWSSRTMAGKWVSRYAAPTFFILVLSLSGCDWLAPLRPKGSAVKKPDEQTEKSAEPSGEVMTQGEKLGFHRWLVKEMQEQIFARASRGNEDVNGWANVLSQRGSIEGVYHGFVLSSEYNALERGKADVKALRFFAQEMAILDYPNAKDTDDSIRLAAEKYAKEYMGVPLFTLKRVLGDKIIKESNARRADKDRLAAWYAPSVSRWARMGVSFGLPERDKPDEAFHFRWAQENNLGMIQWELLNRVHRVMNNYGGVAVSAPAATAAPAPVSATPAGK